MRILVLNGPNLNLLGQRDPATYGKDTLNDLERQLRRQAQGLGVDLEFVQSNQEGHLIDALHRARTRCDAVVFNPGGYAHTSVALRDAIDAIGIPVIEVHISNIHARESFRHTSITAGACVGQISGLGLLSYEVAIEAIVRNAQMKGGKAAAPSSPQRDRDRERERPSRDTRESDDDREGSSKRRRGRRGGRGRRGRDERDESTQDNEQSDSRDEGPDLTERYAEVPDVTIRKGLDVLEDKEEAPRKGGGKVIFDDDAPADKPETITSKPETQEEDSTEEERPSGSIFKRKIAVRRTQVRRRSSEEVAEAPQETEGAPADTPADSDEADASKKSAKKAAKKTTKKSTKKAAKKTTKKKTTKKAAKKATRKASDSEE